MFGLPDGVAACLFDMDGVVTKTAIVHAAAWKQMFDDFLRERAKSTGTEFVPFDSHHDYDAYVDGKPRLDGTKSFLESRGIELPAGSPDDPPGQATLNGLSNRKNDLVLVKIEENGVQVYDGTITFIKAVRDNKTVFQTGTQQRSSIRFRLVCELVRNGRMRGRRTMAPAQPRCGGR